MIRISRMRRRSVIAVVIALLSITALIWTKPRYARATPPGYVFTPVAFLDDPAPGGGNFTFDFQPTAINSRGEVAFTAGLITDGNAEGVFVARQGQVNQVMRYGQPAPGGGTFGPFELGRLGLSEGGD